MWDVGSIPGLGRSPGGGHSNPLQYSCLENPNRQRSLASYTAMGLQSQTQLSKLSTAQHSTVLIHCYILLKEWKVILFQSYWLKKIRYFLTCLLYVSNCVRAAFAFFNSSSKLTVLCMYIMFVSCKVFTCLRRSFRSCSFWRYISTVDSSLFALSEVAL